MPVSSPIKHLDTLVEAIHAHQQARTDTDAAWQDLHDHDKPWPQSLMRLFTAHDRLLATAQAVVELAYEVGRGIHPASTGADAIWQAVNATGVDVDCWQNPQSWTYAGPTYRARQVVDEQRARLSEIADLRPGH